MRLSKSFVTLQVVGIFKQTALFVFLVFSPVVFSASLPFSEWLKLQELKSIEKIHASISPSDGAKGAVIASPSRRDPDYYFHWVRDAAITMQVLVSEFKKTKDESLLTKLKDFALFSRQNQTSPALSGLGEPKFSVDGTPYAEPWGRPQNDGPALRALVLIELGEILIERGEKDWVEQNLYDSRLPSSTVIKNDLEYVSHRWRDPTFDLWEEVMGDHFYTRWIQYAALVRGAEFAKKRGDSGASDWYLRVGREVYKAALSHWSEEFGIIRATLNPLSGEIADKKSGLDTSVLLAVNQAKLFGVTDARVSAWAQKTWLKLDVAFERLYPIHGKSGLGTAYGRYPEDSYFGGNPWFLTTLGVAEFCYSNSKTNSDLLACDPLLSRVLAHVSDDLQMSEQYDKVTGYMLSAYDLTWSYTASITAFQARREAMARITTNRVF